MTHTNKDSLREAILKALVTAPNCMTEKNINGKTRTIFEVQNIRALEQALTSHIEEAERKARIDEHLWYADSLMDKRMSTDDTLQLRWKQLNSKGGE